MTCPKCGAVLNDNAKTCSHCKYDFLNRNDIVETPRTPANDKSLRICPKCQTIVEGKFCTNCGFSYVKRRCIRCGTYSDGEFCCNCGYCLAGKEILQPKSRYNKWIAFFLCFFLGLIGAHRFYVGKTGTGFLMIATLIIFPINVIWVVIDLICIIANCFDDKDHLPLTD